MQYNTKLAEMADTADYAAMNYSELLQTRLAFTMALGLQINPLLETKRLEEMGKITHIYVTAMNGYDATRSEILSCLEKEGMKDNHMFSSNLDVDDQTPDVYPIDEVVCDQEQHESVLLLPEYVESSLEDEGVQDNLTASDPEEKSHDIILEHQDEEKNPSASVSAEADDAHNTKGLEIKGTIDKKKELALVEKALETPEHLANEIDVNVPYFTMQAITLKKNGSIDSWVTKRRKNLGIKELKVLRVATEKYESLFKNNKVLASTDDYLVTYDGQESVFVYRYHFLDESEFHGGLSGRNNNTTKEELKAMKQRTALMKRAIKKAEELSALGETEAHLSFYDRFLFDHHGCNRLELSGNRERFYGDDATLKEIMPAFETYARLCGGFSVLTKDNCIAAMDDNELIYVVLFNIPAKEKKRRRRVSRKSSPAEEASSIIIQGAGDNEEMKKELINNRRLIKKAMIAAKEESMMDETNSPFLMIATYSGDSNRISKTRSFPKIYEDAALLAKRKMDYEKKVESMLGNPLVINKDNCLAVMRNPLSFGSKDIDVVYLHVPNNKDAKSLTCEKEQDNMSDADSYTNYLIEKAVETTKTLGVNDGTDVNAPYYIQQDYIIPRDTELLTNGPSFSFHFSLDRLDKYKALHRKYARAMKATQILSADDYTAFIWNGGKNVCVYYYNVGDTESLK